MDEAIREEMCIYVFGSMTTALQTPLWIFISTA